jgi:hypothetical protein
MIVTIIDGITVMMEAAVLVVDVWGDISVHMRYWHTMEVPRQ